MLKYCWSIQALEELINEVGNCFIFFSDLFVLVAPNVDVKKQDTSIFAYARCFMFLLIVIILDTLHKQRKYYRYRYSCYILVLKSYS